MCVYLEEVSSVGQSSYGPSMRTMQIPSTHIKTEVRCGRSHTCNPSTVIGGDRRIVGIY